MRCVCRGKLALKMKELLRNWEFGREYKFGLERETESKWWTKHHPHFSPELQPNAPLPIFRVSTTGSLGPSRV